MTSSRLVLAALALAACGDNVHPELWPDGAPAIDAPGATADGAAPDASSDAAVDARPMPTGPAAGRWRPGFGLPGAAGDRDARVARIARTPDGSVYIGGSFREVAGVPARNIARWTGSAWQALGDGLPWPVTAMVVDSQGRLWVAGRSLVTPIRLARWNGTRWTNIPGEYIGYVDDMAVLAGDQIVVVGQLLGLVENDDEVARYDGRWRRVGDHGIGGVQAVLATGGAGFCVAGTGGYRAACWNGAAWSPLGFDLPYGVRTLARGPDGRFYAGGRLTFDRDGQRGIAVLDGETWVPFAGGVDGRLVGDVRAIAWIGDDLYIGGHFRTAGREPSIVVNHLARHDGSGWHAVGTGVVMEPGNEDFDLDAGVWDLLVDAGTVWLGGRFTSADGAIATHLARIDAAGRGGPVLPDGPPPLGLVGSAAAVALDGEGRVIVGGVFAGAGTAPASNVARLGADAWDPLGAGLDGAVLALLVRRDGTIVAGGRFTGSGTAPMPHLAAWTGTRWAALGDAPDGEVHALAEGTDGALYAAGAFTHIGGVATNRVARWDGAAWHPLGDGLAADAHALLGAGADLVAGGDFGARRWNGATWTSVGGVASVDGSVRALAATSGGFLALGTFQLTGIASGGLARWDGAAWHAVGQEVVGGSALQPLGAGLFVGPRLSWWDGAAWQVLPGEVDGSALALRGTTLWVGGSSGIAAWDFSAP